MIRTNDSLYSSDGRPLVTQSAPSPVVFLDNWVYSTCLTGSEDLSRQFVSALRVSGGTLLISEFLLVEIASMSSGRAKAAGAILDDLHPDHIAFFEASPVTVSAREAVGQLGAQMSGDVATYIGEGAAALSWTDVLARLGEDRDRLASIRDKGSADDMRVIQQARNLVDADVMSYEEIEGRLVKTAATRTSQVAARLNAAYIASGAKVSANSFRDYHHCVVPLVYADLVVVDKQWTEFARQVQSKTGDLDLATTLLAAGDVACSVIADLCQRIDTFAVEDNPGS